MDFFEVSADIVAILFGCGFMFGIDALLWAWAMEAFGCTKERRSKAKFYEAKASVELSKLEDV